MRILAQLLEQTLGVSVVVIGKIPFELVISLILLWLPIGNLEPQPVPNEGVKLALAPFSKQALNGMPVALVELGLFVVRKRHKNIVAYEIDGHEGLALGVHGLKYELGIIDASGELCVDDLHAV